MGDGLGQDEDKSISLTEVFSHHFPHYLAMGMSSEEFWHGKFDLVKGYREAYKLKQEIKDYEFWKQGMYFYEALLDVSPILHAFAKNGTKPRPYPDKPYGIDKLESEEEKERHIENERLKAKLHFMNLTKILKKQFGEKNDRT